MVAGDEEPSQMKRYFSLPDKICITIDQALRVLTNSAPNTGAAYPAQDIAEAELSDQERKHAAALMRVNHAGEIAAQALYHGQSIASRSESTSHQLEQAAFEEGDHLTWCQNRIAELSSHTSYLSPLWYAGSFCIGLSAGMVGDKWSLGFVAETERQVIKHLESHLELLPKNDARSYAILKRMGEDEAKHQAEAIAAGAHELPQPIQKAMALTAKLMVKTAYWI